MSKIKFRLWCAIWGLATSVVAFSIGVFLVPFGSATVSTLLKTSVHYDFDLLPPALGVPIAYMAVGLSGFIVGWFILPHFIRPDSRKQKGASGGALCGACASFLFLPLYATLKCPVDECEFRLFEGWQTDSGHFAPLVFLLQSAMLWIVAVPVAAISGTVFAKIVLKRNVDVARKQDRPLGSRAN
jgi:hypothetical protein